ncbi:MAG: hypothetical protein GY874_02645 [Desulfobacteraceae bacterium]|nr:hypothetical protein [Desulfobacteraceae bacterium]
MSEISRAIFDALLPPGSIWCPKTGGGFDRLLDAVAANSDEIISFLAQLADIRNPARTTMLSDMEAEYGIRTSIKKTEKQRRAALAAAITDTVSDGGLDTMQAKLTQAGFKAEVHANDPPANPALFISESYRTVAGNEESVFGKENAYFGRSAAGTLLVNGDIYCDECKFTLPENPGYWPLVFFVGGPAVRNAKTGSLEQIAIAPVPVARRDEIKRLILKYKPMHAWCGLIVEFV